MTGIVRVAPRAAARWRRGHPWIYRSDTDDTQVAAGIVRVEDRTGRYLGRALCSPTSEIRLRLLTTADEEIDACWWRRRVEAAAATRDALGIDATAYRVIHAEGDGLPSLIVDRYADYAVVQLLSAGLESVRGDVLGALQTVLQPRAMLLRNDASVRRHEHLPLAIEEFGGSVPHRIDVREGRVAFRVALHTGQKTGAYLDQRDNRILSGTLARGRALDLFCYHGLFAVHMARHAEHVTAIDSSAAALEVAREAAALNRLANITFIEANVFDFLRSLERRQERFDMIVLDPPAFAKQREALVRATAAYKEINLRAMRVLAPAGRLLTCSCSFHLQRPRFLAMLAAAARDSGRHMVMERLLGQALDHPEVVTIPETGYLKGALLRAA